MDYNAPETTNEELIEHLKQEVGVLNAPALENAFMTVDRSEFVPESYRPEAHEDYPVPIGHGQTMSQPTTVAFMLEKLDLRPGNRVLDVGAGSGWTTALCADIVGSEGEVVGVELISELAEFGAANLERAGITNAEVTQADDTLGKNDQAPFDRILVSAATDTIPETLLEQLAPGGQMVLPVNESLIAVIKHEDESVETTEFPGFVFVPLQEMY